MRFERGLGDKVGKDPSVPYREGLTRFIQLGHGMAIPIAFKLRPADYPLFSEYPHHGFAHLYPMGDSQKVKGLFMEDPLDIG